MLDDMLMKIAAVENMTCARIPWQLVSVVVVYAITDPSHAPIVTVMRDSDVVCRI